MFVVVHRKGGRERERVREIIELVRQIGINTLRLVLLSDANINEVFFH